MLTTALLCMVAGVLGQTREPQAPAQPKAAGTANISFVNASPDASTIDVWINGKKEATGLAFGKDSGIKSLNAGKAKIEYKAGDKVLLTSENELAGDKAYTFVGYGRQAELRGHLIEAKASPGKAHVILFHGSPDTATCDVNCDGKNVNKGLVIGKTFETTLDAGKHKIELMGESAQPLVAKDLDLKADTCYTLVALGMSRGNPKLDMAVVAHPMQPKERREQRPQPPLPEKPKP